MQNPNKWGHLSLIDLSKFNYIMIVNKDENDSSSCS